MSSMFISRFTPSLMSPEALEAIFVQREKLADRLVELTRESVLTASKHYTLLIGPRGIGKTHLIALVYHRIAAMDDLRDHLRIAWLREEEWGVTSFLDLLLRIFNALSAEYKDESRRLSESPLQRVESLYELPPDDAERMAMALLKEFVGDRTLLLLMENLDTLFSEFGEAGQRRLRSFLQENPFCAIIATAQSLFNGVSRQTSPFYGFFSIRHLEELDLDEANRLLMKLAEHEKDADLVAYLQTPMGRARVRAIQHLAGGNHRVYVILAQFLTRESLDALVDPFLSTLDDLTPYYQARMAWLSPQQRKIVNFLCAESGAVPVKEIAQRCFMTHQTASSQLKTLSEMGYVRSTSVGRESYYELREPLMRLGVEVKKHRGEPIRLFVEFLRLWYTPAELAGRLGQLRPEAALDREYLHAALRAAQAEADSKRAEAVGGIFKHAYELVEGGRWEEALEALDRALAIEPAHANVWNNRGVALGNLERYAEALQAYDQALAIDPNDAKAWNNRDIALFALNRWDEAIAALDEGLSRFPLEHDTLTETPAGASLRALFTQHDAGVWRERALGLIQLYEKHDMLASLGQGLVQRIPALYSPMISDIATHRWRDLWEELGGQYAPLKIPLRLLNAAVRYRETRDKRVLLRLPVEERKVLEQGLEMAGAGENTEPE